MKRILPLLLLFALSINVTLVQGVTTRNIATPDSGGLSNNQVPSFNVSPYGSIFNNSASGGRAQVADIEVPANPNITEGSEANLILIQVTGSGGSNLEGTIEVFGAEAGVIIANPNGITCDGCGFINANKVDLVTGTANFSGDDLTGFSINSTAILTVSGDGFISDAVADELNLMSGGYSQSGAIDIEGNLNIQVSGEVDVNLSSAASIKANNLFFSAYTIYNQADITIADSATFDIRNKFLNGFYQGVYQRNGGNIRADNFNVIAVGNFSNQHYATINANDFNVVAGGDFTNLFSNISANNFNVVAGGDFSNSDTELWQY